MSEQKKTFEAPVLTSFAIEQPDALSASGRTGWFTNSYAIPDLNDPTNSD